MRMQITPARPLIGGRLPVGLSCAQGHACAGFRGLKKCVTLSTTEAEYVSLADTIKEVVFLRYEWGFIFTSFGSACIAVFEDNKGARYLDHNPVCASNSKHIDVRHHFLRELDLRGEFDIVAVEYEQQNANVLTKALADPVFRFRRDFVMNI